MENMIEILIKKLGLTHEDLISKSVIADDDLIELFPGIDELYFEATPGIDMSFDAETERFQTLYITLKKTTPSTVEFMGELPAPFKLHMTQNEVRAALGLPRHYSGPNKMPAPRGKTGGWESYHVTAEAYAGTELIVGYDESMQVTTLMFSNFLREHMYTPEVYLKDEPPEGQ